MKRKIITPLLWSCILGILSAVWVFVCEVFIGFPAYLDALPEQNWEGLGIIVILIIGLIAGACLFLFALFTLFAANGVKRSKTLGKAKSSAIFGIVSQFLLSGGLIAYAVMMICVYNGGWFGKISYLVISLIILLLAIGNIVSCAKWKPSPVQAPQNAQVQPVQQTPQAEQPPQNAPNDETK